MMSDFITKHFFVGEIWYKCVVSVAHEDVEA